MAVETTQLETDAQDLQTDAGNFLVENASDYESGADLLLAVKDYRKRLNETFDPIIKAAHTTHKEAIGQKKKHDQPAAKAEREIKSKMLTWRQAEEKRAAEERRIAEAEARKKAEEEQLREAEAAEAAGNRHAADRILEQEPVVAPVAVRPAAPDVSGIKVQKRWTFEITDPSLVPRSYCKVDEVKVRHYVLQMKEQAEIPGVRIYQTESMAAGR